MPQTRVTFAAHVAARPPTGHPPESRHDQPALKASLVFGRQFRGGMVNLPYTLDTWHAQQVYRSEFGPLSHRLYMMDNCRRIQGIDAAWPEQAEDQVSHHLAALLGQLAHRRLDTECQLTRHPGAVPRISHHRPLSLQVPIIHPIARDYMEVLLAADAMFTLFRKQWLLGLLDSPARQTRETSLEAALRAVSSLVHRCHLELAGRVRTRHAASRDSPRSVDLVLGSQLSVLTQPNPDGFVGHGGARLN